MAKYSYEFKLNVVHAYLNNEGSYKSVSQKYSMTSITPLKNWVATYEKFGSEGLQRSRKRENYSYNFKLRVVELYLTMEVTYQDIALQVGINNLATITKWVNDYRISGPDALKPKIKGRPPKMKNVSKTKSIKDSTETEDADELKRLREENLKLRIENAYLKEKRRLRQEKTTPKKKRE